MVFNLGVARGSVVLDVTDVERAMGRLQGVFGSGIDQMGTRMAKLSTKFIEVGSSLITLTAPLVGAASAGLKTLGSYQDAMSQIQARAHLTTGEFESVRSKVLEIGRDTQFSATQGAEGFLQLLAAGETFSDSMIVIDDVIQAAGASGLDLGFVADSLTDIMKQYNLTADDAGMIVTQLAQAEGASSATMGDLIYGLRNAGGIAHEFGLSFNDSVSVLSMFSDHGIKASEAGTQLRSMLRFMTNDTERTTGAWKELGANWKNADGTIKPLGEVIELIKIGLDGMTEADRLQALRDLGGAYGQLGLQALVSGESILDFQGRAIMQADAAELAAAKLDTWNGTMKFLQSSIENFWIQTLEPFVNEALRPFVAGITDTINRLADWAGAHPELMRGIIQFLAVLTAAGPILFFIGRGIALLAGLFTVLTSPITMIVGLILLLSGGFQGFIDLFNTYVKPALDAFVQMFISGDWNNLPTVIDTLLKGIISTFRENLVNALGNILQGMTREQQIAFGAFAISIGLVAAAFTVAQIPAAIVAIRVAITALWATAFMPLIPIIAVIAAITLMYANNTLGLRDRIDELGNTLRTGLVAAGQIATLVMLALSNLWFQISTVVLPILQYGVERLGVVIGWGLSMASNVAMIALNLLSGAFTVIGGVVAIFKYGLERLGNFIELIFALAIAVGTAAVDALRGAIDAIGGVVDGAKAKLEELATTVESVASRVSAGLSGIGNIVGGVTSGQFGLDTVVNAIGAEIRGPGSYAGGYTGDGPTNEVAGFHHRKEFVVPHQGALVLKSEGGSGGGDIHVHLPPGFVDPESDPYTQGRSIGRGIKEELSTRGMMNGT